MSRGAFPTAELSNTLQPDVIVLAGAGHSSEAARILRQSTTPVSAAAEALVVRRVANYRGRPALVLYGADARGLMYHQPST